MIARTFRAIATVENTPAYQRFFEETVAPALARIDGHLGAMILTREEAGGIAIQVVTFWQAMDAVRRFAGEPPDRAVVEPEARALLVGFDERVVHHEVALDTLTGSPRTRRQET